MVFIFKVLTLTSIYRKWKRNWKVGGASRGNTRLHFHFFASANRLPSTLETLTRRRCFRFATRTAFDSRETYVIALVQTGGASDVPTSGQVGDCKMEKLTRCLLGGNAGRMPPSRKWITYIRVSKMRCHLRSHCLLVQSRSAVVA